jgi:signal transduction histidine kinase
MKVLFVDPDPHARTEAVGAVLARRGHVMTAAHDATAALAACVDVPFDLVLLVSDTSSGAARLELEPLCRAITHARSPAPFILAMISAQHPQSILALLDVGLGDYYLLPFEPERFEVRLRLVERDIAHEALRRAEADEQARMRSKLVLTDRLVSVGTLAAGVAHEINNPLMYVLTNLEYVSRQLAAPHVLAWDEGDERRARLHKALAQAREGADRVRQIVRGLRTFSRGDEDRRGPVSVQDVLEASIDMAWNEIRHRARLVREYEPVSLVEANEARLGQVFLNLLVNAAQAIPEGAVERNEVRVTLRMHDPRRVLVEMRDTGTGISSEVIGRIFDPFFSTKPVGEGTGLGLSICHGIIENLGGEITVESELGHGSAFRVLIPAAVVAHSHAPSSRPPPFAPGRGRVLIIDDELNLRVTLAQILSTDHEVYETPSARLALERIAGGERYDVILCDVMMPEMSGIDFYEELTHVAPELTARVVFLTGGAFTPRTQAFLERVTNPRLEKPFEVAELHAVIRKVMAAALPTGPGSR